MSLLDRLRVSQFEKGIHPDCIISKVDIVDRKGQNGPINKMIYITFSQINDVGKRLAESELSWWKPEAGNEYFITNLLEICFQLHSLLACYIGEEEAFEAFEDVFKDMDLSSKEDIINKKWKKSEVDILFTNLKEAFDRAIKPYVGDSSRKLRLKLTTNFKGEDVEIPKYGAFTEIMSSTSNLKFSEAELKTHSKLGNTIVKPEASSQKITI